MRLCIFTENYLKGGLDTFIINLINNMSDEVAITLACNKNHKNINHIQEKSKDEMKYFLYQYFTNTVVSYYYKQNNIRSFAFLLRLIEYLLRYTIFTPYYLLSLTLYFRKYNYDALLIVNGGYPGGVLARLAAIAFRLSGNKGKCVLNIHNDIAVPNKLIYFYDLIIDKLISHSVDLLVFPSKNCETTKSQRYFLSKIPSNVIFNGIDLIKLEKSYNEELYKKNLIMIGTYEKRKGHIHLFESVKLIIDKHPDLELYIYGEGKAEEKDSIVKKIKELNLENKIHLMGYSTNIRKHLAEASILVMPSQELESFGLVIIEAMSVGTPVVCTNVGGMVEVLDGSGSGLIVDKDSKLELANAIDKILSDSTLAKQMGNNGMMMQQKKFTAKAMTNAYSDLFLKNL